MSYSELCLTEKYSRNSALNVVLTIKIFKYILLQCITFQLFNVEISKIPVT